MTTIAPFKVGEYHGVELYKVTQEVIDWLRAFGEEGERWFLRSNWIYFPDERDHMLFLLRWQ